MKSCRVPTVLLSILLATCALFAADTAADNTKASRIILPKVEFRQATVEDGLAFFRQKSRALDPAGSGVPIILIASDKLKGTKVDLDLVNVSIADAVKYFAIAAGLELTRDGEAMILKSK